MEASSYLPFGKAHASTVSKSRDPVTAAGPLQVARTVTSSLKQKTAGTGLASQLYQTGPGLDHLPFIWVSFPVYKTCCVGMVSQEDAFPLKFSGYGHTLWRRQHENARALIKFEVL